MREISECKSEQCRCRARLCLFNTKCFGFLINERHLNSTQRVRVEERVFKPKLFFPMHVSAVLRVCFTLWFASPSSRMGWRVYLRKARQKGTGGHFFVCVCVCRYGNFANWQSGNHKLYLLSTEESCETSLPPEIQTHCLSEMEKKKEREKLSACIHSYVLGTREAFSLSGVFREKKEQTREKETGGKWAMDWARFGKHFITRSLSDCPTARLTFANCSGESILLSPVYRLPIWEDLRQHGMSNFA